MSNLLHKVGDYLGKPGTFGGRHPLEIEPIRVHAVEVKQFSHESYSLHSHVITVQVMAITDVSPAHEDAVRALLESLQDLMRPDGRGTERSDGPKIWRVLQAADSG